MTGQVGYALISLSLGKDEVHSHIQGLPSVDSLQLLLYQNVSSSALIIIKESGYILFLLDGGGLGYSLRIGDIFWSS